MEKIIVSESVSLFLHDLVELLYKKEYFSYMESAEEYVDKLIDFIYHELATIQHKSTPKPLLKHGTHYIKYSAGKRTAWYVFFNRKNDKYIIKYITNNHVVKASFLRHLK